MLRHIVPLLPVHHLYCEPFFGGGAVFFAKEPSKIEVINDKNSFVVNFYEQAKHHFSALQELIEETLHSREWYAQAKHIYYYPKFYTPLERARAFWLLANMSVNSCLASDFSYAKSGSSSAQRVAEKRVQFTKELAARLSGTTIESADALEVMPRYDADQSFFYVDPPYIDVNQGHYKGYLRTDYEQLLKMLSSLKGKFMLSSYPNDLLSSAAKNCQWQQYLFDKPLSAGTACQQRAEPVDASQSRIFEETLKARPQKMRRKTEVLACNYEI